MVDTGDRSYLLKKLASALGSPSFLTPEIPFPSCVEMLPCPLSIMTQWV